MVLNRRRRQRERERAERDRDRRKDDDLRAEIESALSKLTDDPSASDVQRVLVAFRREYSTLARRNAARLGKINSSYRKLVRVAVVIGLLFVIVQTVVGLNVLRLLHAQDASQRRQDQTIHAVQTGRRTSLRVACAVESAIAEEGRIIIAGPSTPPPAIQERALEALGFPAFEKRHKQQEKQADGYVAAISKAIDSQVGKKGDKLVRANGQINCRLFSRVVHAG